MLKKKNELLKATEKIDFWQDKYEAEKKANYVKITFAAFGVLMLMFATYRDVESSDVNLQDWHFKANVLHIAGLILIGIPWIKNPLKR